MSKPPIDRIVKDLRGKHGYTQAELAKMAGMSKDALSRLELGKLKGTRTRQKTLMNLAKALRVEPQVLTGEKSIEDDPMGYSPRNSLNIRIDTAADNALTLASRRYGFSRERIVELAPLLFVIAAERSLVRRRNHLSAVKDAFDKAATVMASTGHLGNHMGFLIEDYSEMSQVPEMIRAEESSIANRDIYGDDIPDLLGDPVRENPFTLSLLEDVTDPAVAEIVGVVPDFVIFRICRADALNLVDGDEGLASKILGGAVLLHEMPPGLWAAAAVEARLTWLRDKVAESKKAMDFSQIRGGLFPDERAKP
jgi:transcriptional regulator with XRE-family HTH domain